MTSFASKTHIYVGLTYWASPTNWAKLRAAFHKLGHLINVGKSFHDSEDAASVQAVIVFYFETLLDAK